MTSEFFFKAWVLAVGMTASLATQAQTAPQASAESSYLNRIIKRQGVHDADPNVYAYTAEFARRFQMPEEWVSTELKGVDAVAFRVVPRLYKTCGWSGNPNACSPDGVEVRCEMDLYFDNKHNPLPWDDRRPERYSSTTALSVTFLWDGQRNLAYQRLETPKRKGDHIFASDSPFIDLKTGKGLGWQYFTSLEKTSGWGWRGLVSYDKEIFIGMSLVTLGPPCDSPIAAWALASEGLNTPLNVNHPSIGKTLLLPSSWQTRVQQATQESSDKQKAFFKQEIEKETKALRESPVPSKTIVPVQ